MAEDDFEYFREGHRLKLNFKGYIYGASIEDFETTMARVIDKLIEIKDVETIILSQDREFEYDYPQTKMLVEIAQVITYLIRDLKVLSLARLTPSKCERYVPGRVAFLQDIVINQLRRDPIGAYVRLVREIRHIKIRMKAVSEAEYECSADYLENVLFPINESLEKTELIKLAAPRLAGYHVGDRSVYREIFHPIVRPNFMLTKYMMIPPQNGEEIERYYVGDTEVQIYNVPDKVQNYYHVLPPEFKLTEEEYTVLDTARQYLAEHRPKRSEFAEPERMREVFFNIGRDMLGEIADNMGFIIDAKKLKVLSNILTRYTAGFGILEVILADEKIQDIFINSPIGQQPIFVFHGDYEECITNIVPTREDALAWATRFRIHSGRPLDEANPVLDTEIKVPGGRARVAAITRSLSPEGLAFALRRHRDKPWTFPLFIHYKMFNPLAAGLMSFIIDGARTMLIAGTRSSGKTSVLGSLMTELMRKYRIISVEDTLELPIESLRELGYNVERLKSRSVITHIESELPAEEAIRVSLRLGDSALIIGEVRSVEALALYESMRIGALANVVAGTIHGDSPYGVFDRVVNDLGVPPTSFKATDIIAIANRLRSSDGLHTFRRLTEITELQKDWKEDPLMEKAFVPLMEYNSKKDELEPTETLLNGESYVLNEIAKRVPEWRGNWENVWNNIQLRAKIKETLVKNSKNNMDILEAPFVVRSNNQFHLISGKVRDEYGSLDSKRIFVRWNEWLKNEIKGK